MTEMLSTKISDILNSTDGTLLYHGSDDDVNVISTDSREIDSSLKTLFVPIIGDKFDGHDYINNLCSTKKIAAFLTEKNQFKEIARDNEINCIQVENTLFSLGKIAENYRFNFKIPVIGITGTNGKTTTKELTAQMLSSVFKVHKNEKNYNNEIGVPFALMKLNETHEISVIEMGMNHAGEIKRLSHIVRPDLAVITNVGEGHLEFLETVENVALAKSEIFEGMSNGKVLLNSDMDYFDMVCDLAEKRNLDIYTFGIENKADYMPDSLNLSEEKIDLVLNSKKFSLNMYGMHNAYNLLASIAICKIYNVSSDDISNALSSFKNVEKRSQIIKSDYYVINDTYNSNPLSLKSAILSIKNIYPKNRKIAVLADMKELGDKEVEYHEEAGKWLCENSFDIILTYGQLAKNITDSVLKLGIINQDSRHFETKSDLVDYLKNILKEKDVVLIKGSRSMKMEEVADSLVC